MGANLGLGQAILCVCVIREGKEKGKQGYGCILHFVFLQAVGG